MPNAIVTGASQGFGLQLARALAVRGWTITVDARDASALAATARELPRERVATVAGDVSDERHRSDVVAAAARFGALDVLVHNASELGPSPLLRLAQLPVDAARRIYEVNVLAPMALTQAALPLLLASSGPSVVTLSSDAAVEAYPRWGGYGPSKAALDHVAATLAVEEPALRVYAFDPGDMRTAMHQRAFPGDDISDRADPASVVPALLELLDRRPASGRYRAADIAVAAA